jgi:cytolysin (calcineurin-like family phosphatase)
LPFGDDWTSIDGKPFSLNVEGEKIFLFCYESDGSLRPLHAFSYNGDFQDSGLSDYGFLESALPEALKDKGTIILPHHNNVFYMGPTNQLTYDQLSAEFEKADNWQGRNDARYTLNTGDSANTIKAGFVALLLGVAGVLI